MRKTWIAVALVFAAAGAATAAHVDVAPLEGMIGAATADYFERVLREAETDGAECLVVLLNTPGGVVTTTENVIQMILGARVPVVVYVYPETAGAVSAGTFITIAGHIAAMAPTTRIGAAHVVMIPLIPISLPGREKKDDEEKEAEEQQQSIRMEKAMNDLVALMRGVADRRGRNADWIETSIRESASINEREALELNVIDLIAADVRDLLNKIDGREIELKAGTRTLNTAGASIRNVEMTFRERVLNVIASPNVMFLLIFVAMAGIGIEMYHPGLILPGTVGVFCGILAGFGAQILPINTVGVLLMVFAMVLFVLEIKITSYGLLTIGGIASLILGGTMLIERTEPFTEYLTVSTKLLVVTAVLTGALFFFAFTLGLLAQRRKVMTGPEGLVGEEGVARADLDPTGPVHMHGEIWSAVADQRVDKGGAVRVVKVVGNTIHVQKL